MTDLRVRRVVHASTVIEFGPHAVLTDPWFSQRYGHRWGEPLGVALTELPHLSGVVVSHKDYDHYDMQTFAAYPDKGVPMVVRRGSAQTAQNVGFTNVTELEPWESVRLGPITVTATPAKHKEELGVPQNTYSLQCEGFTVFFGGDTLLIREFEEVARRFPNIDLALLPISGLTIRPLGNKRVVMDANEAAQLTALLKPKVVVPIHYRYQAALYRRPLIRYERDPSAFAKRVEELVPQVDVRILVPGEALHVNPYLENAA